MVKKQGRDRERKKGRQKKRWEIRQLKWRGKYEEKGKRRDGDVMGRVKNGEKEKLNRGKNVERWRN